MVLKIKKYNNMIYGTLSRFNQEKQPSQPRFTYCFSFISCIKYSKLGGF